MIERKCGRNNKIRKILFRGKRIDNSEWVYGDLLLHNNGTVEIFEHKQIMFAGKPLEGRWYKIMPETIGQYTGLVDCRDNKIFEGDIVLVHNDLYDCGLPVVFKRGAFWLYDKTVINADYPNDENAGLDLLGSYNKDFLEVIGNIFDIEQLNAGQMLGG